MSEDGFVAPPPGGAVLGAQGEEEAKAKAHAAAHKLVRAKAHAYLLTRAMKAQAYAQMKVGLFRAPVLAAFDANNACPKSCWPPRP